MAGSTDTKKYGYADLVLEHMPVGVAIYSVENFRLLEANTLFLTNLDKLLAPHLQHGQAIGLPLSDLVNYSEVEVEERSIDEIFQGVARTGTPYRGEAYALRTPAGGLTFWNWTLDPVYDSQGCMLYLIETASEVTSQIDRHIRIKREQQHMRAVLDRLPEGVLIVEANNASVSYANLAAAHLLDIPLSLLIGVSVQELTRHQGSDDATIIAPWNFFLVQVLSGETIISKEASVVHPDGTRIITLISGVPFYAENETMTEALIVLQDITAQKSLEQHKTEFLWMANHELRTPITIIQGFAELLKARDTSLNPITGSLDKFTLNALDNIIEQCDQLERLIEGMYDISSIEQQQFSLHPAKHDMLQLLTQLIDSMAVITRRYHLKLVLEGIQRTDTLPGIFDARRMIQVISNLINNAVKYSSQGSEIEIGLCPLAQVPSTGQYREVLIWVKDQGIGIASRDLPHIFDRFQRSSALDPSISGLGIGLYVVKEVVTLHGGRVWAESTPGQGSTFYVSLPLDLSLELRA